MIIRAPEPYYLKEILNSNTYDLDYIDQVSVYSYGFGKSNTTINVIDWFC